MARGSCGGDGIRHLLRGDWRAAAHSLTPQLSNPRQLLAAGTGPLPAGGECAHLPSAALQRHPDPGCSPITAQRSRSASDGFLFLFEYDGLNRRQVERTAPRPARLRLPRSSYGNYECLGAS